MSRNTRSFFLYFYKSKRYNLCRNNKLKDDHMKCSKCGHKNLYRANFCEKCGCAFDEEYKEKAYGKTIFGLINKIEEIYSWFTLDVILGNKFVKIF